jgi:CheY-like chemotaxis protein
MVRDALLEAQMPTQVRLATTSAELVDRVRAERPSLVVLDLVLDGALEAVRTLKHDADVRRIPIVALSAEAEPAVVSRAYDAGVNTFIAKPATFLALVRLVKVFAAYWLIAAELPPEEAA